MTSEWDKFNLPSFEDNTFLIFGYGSILWKQNFEYVKAYDAFIKGYKRVFYQGSRDHRGTPGKPGRVVTLLPDAAASRVYGKAFQLPSDPEKLFKILDALDVREQGGYDRVEVTLYSAHAEAGQTEETPLSVSCGDELSDHNADTNNGGEREKKKNVVCLCYIATEDNEDYLGVAPIEAMAAQIVDCAGPSGTNREYLFRLADCLRAMEADDPHVYALDAAAKALTEHTG